MGTIVSKDVKAGDIVVGSGQRVVGKRNESHTAELLNKNKFLLIKGGNKKL
jgi:acetyltransferase-like isoleucine patch superfamily enzyme